MLELLMGILSCCLLKLSDNENRSRKTRAVANVLSYCAMAISVALGLWGDFQNGQTWQSMICEFLWVMVACVFAASVIVRIYRYRRKKNGKRKN